MEKILYSILHHKHQFNHIERLEMKGIYLLLILIGGSTIVSNPLEQAKEISNPSEQAKKIIEAEPRLIEAAGKIRPLLANFPMKKTALRAEFEKKHGNGCLETAFNAGDKDEQYLLSFIGASNGFQQEDALCKDASGKLPECLELIPRDIVNIIIPMLAYENIREAFESASTLDEYLDKYPRTVDLPSDSVRCMRRALLESKFGNGCLENYCLTNRNIDKATALVDSGLKVDVCCYDLPDDGPKGTPLHLAAYLGNGDFCQRLLSAGAKPYAIVNHAGVLMYPFYIAMMMAMKNGDLSVMNIFLAAGVKDQPVLFYKNRKLTLLETAVAQFVMTFQLSVLELYPVNLDQDQREIYKVSQSFKIINLIKIAARLIEAQCGPIDLENTKLKEGLELLLHGAAQHDLVHEASIFIRHGADKNAIHNGKSAVEVARNAGSTSVVDLL